MSLDDIRARTADAKGVRGVDVRLTPSEAEALLDVVDALEDALGAIEAHRADMHERSHRPCSTCARSERALEQGSDALARFYGDSGGES